MASGSLSNLAEKVLHRLDVVLRRNTRLGQFPGLRKILLKPYRKLMDFHGRGILMNIGGCIPARMPAEYAWKTVEVYEPETLRAMKNWLEIVERPRGDRCRLLVRLYQLRRLILQSVSTRYCD